MIYKYFLLWIDFLAVVLCSIKAYNFDKDLCFVVVACIFYSLVALTFLKESACMILTLVILWWA